MKPIKSKILVGATYLKKQILKSEKTGLKIALDIETTSLLIHDAKITWISWCIGNLYGAIPLRHRNFDINSDIFLQREKRNDTDDCRCEQINNILQQTGPHAREYLCNNSDEGYVRNLIKELHSNPLNTIIWHNGKFDLSILIASDWICIDEIRASVFDTLLASYVLNPVRDRESSNHSLKELHDVYLRGAADLRQPEYFEMTNGLKFEDIKLDEAAYYASFDALSAFHLYQKFQPELESDLILSHYFWKIEMQHLYTTIEMTISGLGMISAEEVESRGLRTVESIEDELLDEKRRIFKLLGFTFNFESPNVLRGVIFGRLQVKSIDRNRRSNTSKIDSTTLGKIIRAERVRKNVDPQNIKILSHIMNAKRLAEILKKHREMYQYLNSTTGRSHPNFRQTTASGRYAASRPNVLSLPSMTGIKGYIVPGDDKVFVIADFSQIDFRVIANESWEIDRKSKMLASVNRGDDLHLSTLKIVRPDLKIPDTWIKILEEENSVIIRRPEDKDSTILVLSDKEKAFLKQILVARKDVAKQVNFGIAYGLSAASLLENLNNPKEFKKQIIDLAVKKVSSAEILNKVSALEPKIYIEEEVNGYLANFHNVYPGIRQFQNKIAKDLQERGFTYNLFGKLCRTQVVSHFSSGVFDIMVERGKWYRIRMKTIRLDEKFIYGVLLEINELQIVDAKNNKKLDLIDIERTLGYRVYTLDEAAFEKVLSDFSARGSVSDLLRGLDAIHAKANWHTQNLFKFIQAHTPHLLSPGHTEPIASSGRFPFVKIAHRQIKFVWNKEETIDHFYPGYDQLKRNLISVRIQSASMDFCKIAMFTFRSKAREKWPDLQKRPKIVNCIHDEIAVECHESQRDEVKKLLVDCMSNQENFRKFVTDGRFLEVIIGAEDKVGINYKGDKK